MRLRWAAWAACGVLGVYAETCVLQVHRKGAAQSSVDVAPLFQDGPLTATHTIDTPPSITHTQIQMDLCAPLPRDPNTDANDACAEGTTICKKVINEKHGDKRVTQVIPVATREEGLYDIQRGHNRSPERYMLYFVGPSYAGKNHTVEVHVLCDPEHTKSALEFADTTDEFQLTFNLRSAAVCRGRYGPPSAARSFLTSFKHVFSFFFWVGVAAFVLYLLGGIWSNYTYYGARGWDLLPNRDFWRETPYMVQDMFRHVMHGSGARETQGGYDPL